MSEKKGGWQVFEGLGVGDYSIPAESESNVADSIEYVPKVEKDSVSLDELCSLLLDPDADISNIRRANYKDFEIVDNLKRKVSAAPEKYTLSDYDIDKWCKALVYSFFNSSNFDSSFLYTEECCFLIGLDVVTKSAAISIKVVMDTACYSKDEIVRIGRRFIESNDYGCSVDRFRESTNNLIQNLMYDFS